MIVDAARKVLINNILKCLPLKDKRNREEILKEIEKKSRKKSFFFFFRKKAVAKVLNIAQVKEDENQAWLIDPGGFRRARRAEVRLSGIKDWVVGQEKEVFILSEAWLSVQKGRGERGECLQKGCKRAKEKNLCKLRKENLLWRVSL